MHGVTHTRIRHWIQDTNTEQLTCNINSDEYSKEIKKKKDGTSKRWGSFDGQERRCTGGIATSDMSPAKQPKRSRPLTSGVHCSPLFALSAGP